MYGDTCKIGVVSCSLLCLQQKFLIVVELEQIYLYIAYIHCPTISIRTPPIIHVVNRLNIQLGVKMALKYTGIKGLMC